MRDLLVKGSSSINSQLSLGDKNNEQEHSRIPRKGFATLALFNRPQRREGTELHRHLSGARNSGEGWHRWHHHGRQPKLLSGADGRWGLRQAAQRHGYA